jgi:hypothetical protein
MSYLLRVKANSLSYNQAAQANLLSFLVSSQQKTIAAMNDHGIQVLCIPSCFRRVGYQKTGTWKVLTYLITYPCAQSIFVLLGEFHQSRERGG